MDWKEVGNNITEYAPKLGGLFGLPGAAIGGAVGVLGRIFGFGDNEPNPEELMQAIKADPQAALKLRIAEMDYQIKMREQDLVELKTQIEPYIEELRAKTIPWIDGLHKMGRQILNAYTISMVFVLLMTGHAITPEAAALIGGPNMIYQFIKGKGEK